MASLEFWGDSATTAITTLHFGSAAYRTIMDALILFVIALSVKMFKDVVKVPNMEDEGTARVKAKLG